MPDLKAWISALRPRTLFLAVATSLCGSGIAYSTGRFSTSVFILTMLIATILQLLSNMANDLGDFEHGTDITGERIGPQRTLQSGAISPKQMKKAIGFTIILAAIVGSLLIYEALKFLSVYVILIFLFLGLASIVAAVKYTAGKKPYGYKGLGDIFSFIFFGLVSVAGTYFLHTHKLDFRPWLPAIGMGMFTVAVLNVNNMRDMENDIKSGKITIASRLGMKNAKIYHAIITLIGIFCFIAYSIIYSQHWYQFLYLPVLFLFVKILIDIFNTKEAKELDPYLKYTSMASFILSLTFCISTNLSF
ncbi:MAG: 1,4-dihydroxy-2-naphthoate octaprenyltransferase [Dysgonomonas sp.]